jgi:hypothetical protein
VRVKALKVIRSSHLSNDIVLPGDIGEVLTTSIELSGRKLLKVRWAKWEGVALPSDVEELVATVCNCQFMNGYCVGCGVEEPSLAVQENPLAALAASLLPSRSEAASSSPDTMHPVLHGDRLGQEPVGSLPHFYHKYCELGSRAWYSEFYDLGGD